MNNRVLCSTGTYIGADNGYDPSLIPVYGKSIDCDAFEFMVVSGWKSLPDAIAHGLRGCGMRFETFHSDKNIGMLLSDHNDEGAYALFEASLRGAREVGAEKLILHLWGGYGSDNDAAYNISRVGMILERCLENGITLCVENVPCSAGDPMSHWRALAGEYDDLRFIYDTRFAAFAGQIGEAEKLFSDSLLAPRIVHMHISDFAGPEHNFKRLRPIPQPGCGVIDFDRFFKSVAPLYDGTITLESPALYPGGRVDTDELNSSISYIKRMTGNRNY